MNGMRILMVAALGFASAGCTSTSGGDPSPPASAHAGFGGPARGPSPADSPAVSPVVSPVVSDVDEVAFHTPSKNIFCSLTHSAVRCDIVRKTWQPPAKPADCSLDWGNGMYINAGKAGMTCTGDTLIGSKSHNLPYGHGLRSGDVVCDSEPAGLTCRDEKSRRGFTLAVARYSVF